MDAHDTQKAQAAAVERAYWDSLQDGDLPPPVPDHPPLFPGPAKKRFSLGRLFSRKESASLPKAAAPAAAQRAGRRADDAGNNGHWIGRLLGAMWGGADAMEIPRQARMAFLTISLILDIHVGTTGRRAQDFDSLELERVLAWVDGALCDEWRRIRQGGAVDEVVEGLLAARSACIALELKAVSLALRQRFPTLADRLMATSLNLSKAMGG